MLSSFFLSTAWFGLVGHGHEASTTNLSRSMCTNCVDGETMSSGGYCQKYECSGVRLVLFWEEWEGILAQKWDSRTQSWRSWARWLSPLAGPATAGTSKYQFYGTGPHHPTPHHHRHTYIHSFIHSYIIRMSSRLKSSPKCSPRFSSMTFGWMQEILLTATSSPFDPQSSSKMPAASAAFSRNSEFGLVLLFSTLRSLNSEAARGEADPSSINNLWHDTDLDVCDV